MKIVFDQVWIHLKLRAGEFQDRSWGAGEAGDPRDGALELGSDS